MQGGDPAGVGLELSQSLAVDPAQPGDPVGPSPALELIQAWELLAVDRDDDLAAALVGYPVTLAEGVHVPRPFHAQLPLQRPGCVVDAGVHDARVVAALVTGELGLALEHAHARPRTAEGQLARDSEADYATADDGDVAAVWRLEPGQLAQAGYPVTA